MEDEMAGTDVTACPATTPEQTAGIEPEQFRRVMGSLLSGVCIIGSADKAGAPCGLTCSAVCSVSLEPPLLLFCVKTPSSTLDAIRARGAFVVSLLDVESHAISDLFAKPAPDKFASVAWRGAAHTGLPLIDAALAHAECAVHDIVEAGDHVIVLGRVLAGDADPRRFPLGYWRRDYMRVLRPVDFLDGTDTEADWIGEF
ncbi:flavoprotein oxygenase [Nocardia terpenica]|uniref:Flavoprotein oxygenase n=2 Tax=Nocardia terpenica TaxID=455432 RepID=A0A291RH44_9NOCA|nr:flavoprotein oxygenase [Nocardia terpenica]